MCVSHTLSYEAPQKNVSYTDSTKVAAAAIAAATAAVVTAAAAVALLFAGWPILKNMLLMP